MNRRVLLAFAATAPFSSASMEATSRCPDYFYLPRHKPIPIEFILELLDIDPEEVSSLMAKDPQCDSLA